jgi:putative transposase
VKQILTLVVRIEPTVEQYKLLDDTAVAFASACTWINDKVNSNLTNRNSIQAVCYNDVKSQFGLTANHVVRACARVGANRLTAKQKRRKVKGFKPTSFDCDARTFRIIEEGYLVSLSTTGKRVKVPMRVSNYHIGKLKGSEPNFRSSLPASRRQFLYSYSA